jgi:hypothetical protein
MAERRSNFINPVAINKNEMIKGVHFIKEVPCYFVFNVSYIYVSTNMVIARL